MLDLAKHLEIYGIPSFLVFKDHDEVGRLVNKLRKSYKEVKTFIENVITEGWNYVIQEEKTGSWGKNTRY